MHVSSSTGGTASSGFAVIDFPYLTKLADFGIAKLFDETAEKTATSTGAAIGTVPYMSPEQAAGKTSQIGPHSDVYGLGAILYELLTGRPPFELDSRMATLQRVIAEEPTAPRSLRPAVAADLEAICLKSLEKRPADRYPNAAALAADLDRFLAGEPVSVRPVGKVQKTIRRLRHLPLSTKLALAGLVACLLASLLLNRTNSRVDIDRTKGLRASRESEYLNGIERVSQGYFDAVSNRGDAKTAVKELNAFLNASSRI